MCCLIAAGFPPRTYLIRNPRDPIVFRPLYYSPLPLQLQFLPLCLCFLHLFLIIWLHRAASCHSLHTSSLFFLFSCIMPSFSESSCCPECDPLPKQGLNEGGAQIIRKQRKTSHLKRAQKGTSSEPEWPP